jgi:hypothetical protein
LARWGEEVGVRDAQVGEEGVRAVDGAVAAEGGVRQDAVGGRGVGGDVGACYEEDEDVGRRGGGRVLGFIGFAFTADEALEGGTALAVGG